MSNAATIQSSASAPDLGTLGIGSPKVPSDLFAFVPNSTWEVDADWLGVRLTRKAMLGGRFVRILARVALERASGNGTTDQLLLDEVCAEFAGRNVEIPRGISAMIDEWACEAIGEYQDELMAAMGDRGDD